MSAAPPSRVPTDWPLRNHSRSVRVGPLDWHVQVTGRGPTIVLLHGTGASTHSWAGLVPALEGRATVVVPDLPGHGYTTGALAERMSLPRIAEDLDGLLDALELTAPTVVAGHSAGAALALRWALRAPRPTLRAVVGFNPSLVPPPAIYTRWLGPLITPIATAGAMSRMLAAVGARTGMVDRLLASTGSTLSAPQRALYARLFARPEHLRGALGFMAAADLPALLDELRGFDTPTHFVLGARDPWIPEAALRRVLGIALAKARLEAWDGGHLLHELEPLRAAAVLHAALAKPA